MTSTHAMQLMQDTFASMQRSGMLQERIIIHPETVILGVGSTLDSLGFVTFISDLEERVSEAANTEVFLVLTEIHDFNADQAVLSASVLARYIESITA